jgi:hypothetical protein
MKQRILCLFGWHEWISWHEYHSTIWEHGTLTLTYRRCTNCRREERLVPVIRHLPAHWVKDKRTHR